MAWLSRTDLSRSDKLFNDMLNSLANDDRYWGGDVNAGGHRLSNVVLDGSGSFSYTLSPITLTQGADGESRLELRSGSGPSSLLRWALTKDSTAEGGANAGSNFALNRYKDDGTLLGTPFAINRATGVITMGAQAWTGPVNGGGQTLSNVTIAGTLADPTQFKGDLIVRNASVITRVAVGADGFVLTADAAQATGVKWAAPVGQVTSVFTRIGAVIAKSGDYTAAQVTNAVDVTGAYPNPDWLTTLAWTKITGKPTTFDATYLVNGTQIAARPALNLVAGSGTIIGGVDTGTRVDITVTATGVGGGMPQSPWASVIEGGGFPLNNAGPIGVGAPATTGIYVVGDVNVTGAYKINGVALPANIATADISFVVNDGGGQLGLGVKGDLAVDFPCTITGWTLLADAAGSVVVNVWKVAYAAYPSTAANVITGTAPPTISGAAKAQSTTLTGWTVALAAGDTLRFNVDSCSAITRVSLILKVVKT